MMGHPSRWSPAASSSPSRATKPTTRSTWRRPTTPSSWPGPATTATTPSGSISSPPQQPQWGNHLTNTGQRTDSPPTLASNALTDRLYLEWVGTTGVFIFGRKDDGSNIAAVDLSAQGTAPLTTATVQNGILTVRGSWPAPANDTITLDRSPAGGVRLIVNGALTDYAPGSLSGVDVATGTGSNTIDVRATVPGVPVPVEAAGQTTIQVGAGGPVQSIQSDLSIWGQRLSDPISGASVAFSVSDAGTVSHDKALEGALTGAGTSTLMVQGRQVTINATALSPQTLVVNVLSYQQSFQSTSPMTLTLLPGDYALWDLYDSSAMVRFTLNPDGSINYPAAEASLLSSPGKGQLIITALS
jgi:hypothetical protein